MKEKKDRTMKEILEEEIKRNKVKDIGRKAREFIKEGNMEQVSHLYPHFDGSFRSQSLPKESRTNNMQPEVLEVQNVRQSSMPKKLEPGFSQNSPHYEKPSKQPDPQPQPPQQGFKKKQRPAWSMTQTQHEEAEAQEVDELLNFMDQFDPTKYAEDVQVRELMESLKERVDLLKKEDNWKENWEKRLKEKRKKREEEYLKEKSEKAPDDDMIAVNGDNQSQIGVMGGSLGSRGETKTVLSEKTQGTVVLRKNQSKASKKKWNYKVKARETGTTV